MDDRAVASPALAYAANAYSASFAVTRLLRLPDTRLAASAPVLHCVHSPCRNRYAPLVGYWWRRRESNPRPEIALQLQRINGLIRLCVQGSLLCLSRSRWELSSVRRLCVHRARSSGLYRVLDGTQRLAMRLPFLCGRTLWRVGCFVGVA